MTRKSPGKDLVNDFFIVYHVYYIMKVVIATPLYPPDIGGPATYTKILEDELAKRGHEVRVVSFRTVRHFPKGLSHLAYFFRVFQGAYGADIIYALDPFSVGLPSLLAAMVRAKPFAARIAGDYAWEQGVQRFGVKENLDEFVLLAPNRMLFQVRILRAVERFVARRAAKVIVPSEYLKRIVHAWGIPKDKIEVIANAFEGVGEIASRESQREKLGLSGTILFSAGRLVPWKGFGTLIAFMSELRKTHPDARLFIAGTGPLEDELKKAIIAHHVAPSVTLLGNVPHALLMQYIAASDCFVLNTGYEGLSHLLLEVLAIGTPVVTTSVGGNPELIEEGKTGLLVTYDNREELLRAIRQVFDQKEEAMVRAAEGKMSVGRFTVKRMVEETLVALKKVIERP